MNTQVTEQLNIEIQKLKENDYSSYQNFYNQTSGYLYGVIWSIVNNQEAADVIISELYTNIYSSISTELTDNSQFYLWAYNKAQNLTTTYLTTHNVNGDDNSWHKEEAVVAAATNAGMESAAGTTGMGMAHNLAVGGGQVGMGTAAGGLAGAGMGTATGGLAGAGIGTL